MILYPAIDILEGQVVRLIKGDFNQQTVFFKDPLEALEIFESQGAEYLHLVDLSGAKNPLYRQTDLIQKMTSHSNLKIQVGGGVRSVNDIKELLDLGVERVVVGSIAITDPEEMNKAFKLFGPDKITLALDVMLNDQDVPIIKTHGWTKDSGKSFKDIADQYSAVNLKRVLCTDISVDGLLTGPNVNLYSKLQKEFPHLEIQASGGVEKLEDLKDLININAHSVIIGRALLAKHFTLSEALAYAK